MGVLRGEPEGELVEAGATDDDRTCRFQGLNAWGGGRSGVTVERRAAGGDPAPMVDQILESDRNPGKGAGARRSIDLLVGLDSDE